MGRHADPDASSFYRSFGASVLKATMVAVALLGVVLIVAWANLRDAGGDESTQVLADQVTAASAEPEQDGAGAATGDRDRRPAAASSKDNARDVSQAAPPHARPPAQTSVQVLDGVGDSALTEQVVRRLREMGYQIVAVNPSVRDYATTTVLYTDGFEAEAQALQRRDARFTKRGSNPNLAESVNLHVVVGADWPP